MATAEVKCGPIYVNGWWLSLVLTRVMYGTEFLYNHLNIDMSRVVSNKRQIRWIYSEVAFVEAKSSPTYILVLNWVSDGTGFLRFMMI